MKNDIREKAIKLRKSGWSYNVIHDRLGVSKSSLSHWLRDVPYTPNETVRKRIKNGPFRSNVVRHEARMKTIAEKREQASREVGKLSDRDVFMLGVGLYMGEGTKRYEQIRIINSDPNIVKLAVVWLKDVCGLNRENLRITIHIYPDVDENKAKLYWSKITKIPPGQFGKTQVDRRENKTMIRAGKLQYGTAHVTTVCSGDANKGVLLHRRIVGWIEAVNNQMRV